MSEQREIPIKHIPFPEIPRFPATEFEINGRVETVPAEYAPLLPTEETTAFNNATIMRSADLLTRYISLDTNPKDRKSVDGDIAQFCFDPKRSIIFQDHLASIIDSIKDKPEDEQDKNRLQRYQNLFDKLNKHKPAIIEQFTHPAAVRYQEMLRSILLPERLERKMPEVIDMVNVCLKEAYPQEFGTIIPKLTQEAIYLTSDESYSRYSMQKKSAEHSVAIRHNVEIDKYNAGIPGEAAPSLEPDFEVIDFLPNKPIFFPVSKLDKYLRAFLHLPNGAFLGQANVARFLIHENMHRAQGYKVVYGDWYGDPELLSNLTKLSLATRRYDLRETREGAADHELSKRQYDELVREINEHGDFVITSGGDIQAIAIDEDNQPRVITQGGHDLNEAITEYLIVPALAFLNRIVDTRMGQKQEPFKNPLEHPEASVGSFQRKNPSSIVIRYLERLGLKDRSAVLKAFAASEIPILHAKRFPENDYYT